MGASDSVSNDPCPSEEKEGGVEKQADILKEKLFNSSGSWIDDACFKLLDHARGLFVYWAGQRLTTIRYFVAFYSIFIVAYGNFLLNDGMTVTTKEVTLRGISGVCLVITLVFWGLDLRNSELVKNAERAMDVLERALANKLPFYAIRMTFRGDNPKCFIIQYKWIINCFFAVSSVATFIGLFCTPLPLVQIDYRVCPLELEALP